MSAVVVLGNSHLERISRNFEFLNNFTFIARSGPHLSMWLEKKSLIRCHNVRVGPSFIEGTNLTAKPQDVLGY